MSKKDVFPPNDTLIPPFLPPDDQFGLFWGFFMPFPILFDMIQCHLPLKGRETDHATPGRPSPYDHRRQQLPDRVDEHGVFLYQTHMFFDCFSAARPPAAVAATVTSVMMVAAAVDTVTFFMVQLSHSSM